MRIITDTAALSAFTAELERGAYVAIDTEFMRDSTYWPKLCLLQAAGPGSEAIIDPLAKDIDLAPFYQLMANESVLKAYDDHPYHKIWTAAYEKVRVDGTTTFNILGQ